MALQGTGPIKYSEIIAEFGSDGLVGIGSYRISENIGGLSNLPLDADIPQSGSINFSDFYNKKLNVVVDCFSGDVESRANARSKWFNDDIVVVGGFSKRPSSTTGKKVIINVNKTFYAPKSTSANVCALKTGGSWDVNTDLRVDVTSSGRIYGAGGNGARGGDARTESGGSGNPGTSGLGIQYNASVIVHSGAVIAGGGGGGGGGGAARDEDPGADRDAGGGGGGGGASGYIVGSGGVGGEGESDGSGGNPGGSSSGGNRGEGGNDGDEAIGGDGGKGGGLGAAGSPGGDGEGENEDDEGPGGSGGGAGSAIRRNSGVSFSLSNSGSITGPTDQTGVE